MGRPVGNRIRQVLEVVDAAGPSTVREILPRLVGVEVTNASKYCRRAVALGLMQAAGEQRPARYAAAPGWRERLAPRKHRTKSITQPAPAAGVTQKSPPNSVFALGAI